MILPKEFEDRMRAILGEEYEAFSAAMDTSPVRALRVNTLKCSPEDFERDFGFGYDKLPFCNEGYRFDCEHIGAHPMHHAGAVYVQEPAAMAAVEAVEIEPGMKILDVCASPGGKSTQAAAKLCGKGIIVTNEIDSARCRILAQNIERMGVLNAVVANTDSAELGEAYRCMFDLVIVDAPCSGEGMMRKNPLAVSEWSIDNINMCAERQSDILRNIAFSVKEGGRLLYSTCTFAPEENEMQIATFLSEHPDFHLIPVNEGVRAVTSDGLQRYQDTDLGEEMVLCRRFYPHISNGEGQFIALLERDAAELEEASKSCCEKRKKSKKNDRGDRKLDEKEAFVLKAFLADVLSEEGVAEAEKYKLTLWTDGNYYLTPDIVLLEERSLRAPGVAVGSVQKGRVIPHHSFFMAYGRYFKRKIILSVKDERVGKYLHGESICADIENGYAAVLIGSAAVGGAKVTAREAKNYYPKGLRC